MTAPGVARRLVAKYGTAGAMRQVFNRRLHWAFRSTSGKWDAATLYLHTDFWERTGNALGRWA